LAKQVQHLLWHGTSARWWIIGVLTATGLAT
jgi:hypothetical protein